MIKIGSNHFSQAILFSPLQCATTHVKLAQNRHLLYSQLPSTLLASTSTHETDGAGSVLNWEPTLEHSDEAILLSDMHTSPATSWTEYFKVPIVPKNPQL